MIIVPLEVSKNNLTLIHDTLFSHRFPIDFLGEVQKVCTNFLLFKLPPETRGVTSQNGNGGDSRARIFHEHLSLVQWPAAAISIRRFRSNRAHLQETSAIEV